MSRGASAPHPRFRTWMIALRIDRTGRIISRSAQCTHAGFDFHSRHAHTHAYARTPAATGSPRNAFSFMTSVVSNPFSRISDLLIRFPICDAIKRSNRCNGSRSSPRGLVKLCRVDALGALLSAIKLFRGTGTRKRNKPRTSRWRVLFPRSGLRPSFPPYCPSRARERKMATLLART